MLFFETILETVRKLNDIELSALLAAVIEWNGSDVPGTTAEFKEWLANQRLTEAEEWEATRLLAEAEERETAARMLPPADPAAWG